MDPSEPLTELTANDAADPIRFHVGQRSSFNLQSFTVSRFGGVYMVCAIAAPADRLAFEKSAAITYKFWHQRDGSKVSRRFRVETPDGVLTARAICERIHWGKSALTLATSCIERKRKGDA